MEVQNHRAYDPVAYQKAWPALRAAEDKSLPPFAKPLELALHEVQARARVRLVNWAVVHLSLLKAERALGDMGMARDQRPGATAHITPGAEDDYHYRYGWRPLSYTEIKAERVRGGWRLLEARRIRNANQVPASRVTLTAEQARFVGERVVRRFLDEHTNVDA